MRCSSEILHLAKCFAHWRLSFRAECSARCLRPSKLLAAGGFTSKGVGFVAPKQLEMIDNGRSQVKHHPIHMLDKPLRGSTWPRPFLRHSICWRKCQALMLCRLDLGGLRTKHTGSLTFQVKVKGNLLLSLCNISSNCMLLFSWRLWNIRYSKSFTFWFDLFVPVLQIN